MKSYCKGLKVDRDLVAKAYGLWCLADSGRKNQWRVVREYGSPGALVDEIVSEVRCRRLTLRPIRYYDTMDTRKKRHIGQESIKQQVLDYVAVTAMEDFLNSKIGFYQVSSVPGKGSVFASKTVKRWIRDEDLYWVHLDVRKCYASIGHGEVTEILNKYVRSSDVLYICETLLNSYESGLNIGSYFSLKMSQLVLSFGYHLVEGLSTSRRGTRRKLVDHQLWYADDIYLFSRDKRNLRKAIASLRAVFKHRFGLDIKPWKVCRTGEDEPPDVAGYVCRPSRVSVRGSLYLRARRAFASFDAVPTLKKARSVCSYWGWLKNSNSRSAVRRNGYDRIFRNARRYVSSHERKATASGSYPVVNPA